MPNHLPDMSGSSNEDSQSYKDKAYEMYNQQYEKWMPWMEDQYLKWFTKDNKASYTAKDQLSKTKVTGVDQVDSAQDNIHTLLGDQLGKGGIAQPLGDAVSKEGITRAEEGDSGPLGGYGQDAMDGATSGLKSVGDSVGGGVKGATDGAVDHLGLGGLGGGKK